jgi:hypothetical protein
LARTLEEELFAESQKKFSAKTKTLGEEICRQRKKLSAKKSSLRVVFLLSAKIF